MHAPIALFGLICYFWLMRKASYIIALSLITVFFTGHYFIYKSVLISHKKEFKTYIRSHFAKIEQIEILPSELYTDNSKIQWLDENKEICLNGVMFDIVTIKNEGAKVVLNVVKDKDEKELMNRYQKQFNDIYENGNTGKKNNNLMKDFLSLKYFQKTFSQINLISSEHNYSSGRIFTIPAIYISVQTPPPLV